MSRTVFRWFFAAGLILVLVAGIASAATVSPNISFSGNLTNAAGTPLTGTYTVTFRLYNVAGGGTALGIDTHAVTASKGQYTTWLTFPAGRFNGQALWVGVQRAPDAEKSPRAILYPAPFALGLRPGAVIAGPGPAPAINLSSGAGIALFASGKEGGYFTTTQPGTLAKKLAAVRAVTNKNYNPGIDVLTSGFNSFGINISTTGAYSNGVESRTRGPYSNGFYARTEGNTSYGVNSLTTGANSIAVSGTSLQDTGVYGNGKTGAYFTSNQAGNGSFLLPAVNVSTAYEYNPGIAISTKGESSDGISINTTGIYTSGVFVVAYGQKSAGINAHVREQESVAVQGVAYKANSTGVFGMSEGADSAGVQAYSTGLRNDAVNAYADGAGSRGVYGESKYGTGIYGKGREGGFFTTRQAGDVSHQYPGVNVSTTYAYNPGISVRATGAGSRGISSYAAQEYGVYGESVGMAGVRGQSNTAGGVYGRSQNEYGVYGVTDRADHMYGMYTPDRMSALAYDTNAGDIAEYMPVTGNPGPGTVVVIGDDGKLEKTATSYDTRVAGIISTEPGVVLGTGETGNFGEAQIAIAGRVPCNVDATKIPIHAGDLLTTSDRPGYAMKAEPDMVNGHAYYPDGSILGKAMGSLESGTGSIEVLVTLQ